MRPRNLIFMFVALIHMIWGWTLIFSDEKLHVTGVTTLINMCGGSQPLAGMVFVTAGFLAIFSIVDWFDCTAMNIACITPQQVLVFLGTIGALTGIVSGTFADGTLRSSAFLLMDKVWLVLLCGFHTAALVIRLAYPAKRIIYEVRHLSVLL